jgi:hypothetical protein
LFLLDSYPVGTSLTDLMTGMMYGIILTEIRGWNDGGSYANVMDNSSFSELWIC